MDDTLRIAEVCLRMGEVYLKQVRAGRVLAERYRVAVRTSLGEKQDDNGEVLVVF